MAGEIGHTFVRDHAGRCRCGNRGCLETVASVTAVKDQLARARVVIDRYALPDTASALSIRLAGLGLRSEVLGAVAVAGRQFGRTAAAGVHCN